ncbi:TonB-dependent siderophore receptor [Pseudoalteromonas undina]|uniref:TonB-dependent siderophore receptor n=1 Tax=Pseudoalteromonas undina TaxID=43660 RepID=UPI00384BCF64
MKFKHHFALSIMKKNALHICTLSSAISIALSSSLVLANEQTSQNESQEDNTIERIAIEGRYTVNEHIDTATGLGLSIRETPQSVTVFTDERIKDQALNTIIDTIDNTVGMSSSKTDNVRNTMQSRGFTISNYQLDGVPLSWSVGGDSGETSADVSIYERVEFVRGATGLLSGAGDPSASINLVRKRANDTDLTGYVTVTGGSWNKKQLTADVSSGLNESGTIRGRVVGKYTKSDSHVDLYEDDKSVVYGVLEADLTDNTLFRVGGHYQNSEPTGSTWGALPGSFSDGSITDWDISKTTAADWTSWETTNKNYFASLEHFFDNDWKLAVNYNHSQNSRHSKLIYLWGPLDKVTGEGLTAQRYHAFGSTEQDSIDLQLKGQYELFERQHEFVVGALYSKQEGQTSTYDPDPIGGGGSWDVVDAGNFYEWKGLAEPDWTTESTQQDDNKTNQSGVYVATRLSITDEFKLIGGGRLSSWDRERVYYGELSDYGDDGVFVPYFGALYDLTKQHRVYASYTEIFKPQNSLDANGDLLDPLTGLSAEIGLKSAYFNERLQTSLAIFQIEQDNLAVKDPNYIPTEEQKDAYYGAQGTESTGFELEVLGEITESWNISAGYSQFEAEDADGVKVNTDTPRKQFKLFTTYQLTNLLPELTIGGGLNWQSEGYIGSDDSRLTQEAYTLVNVMARYEFNNQMDLQLNIDNLLDKKYYNYLKDSWGSKLYRYGTPQNVTVSFNYNF